jgi:hypothetical protein
VYSFSAVACEVKNFVHKESLGTSDIMETVYDCACYSWEITVNIVLVASFGNRPTFLFQSHVFVVKTLECNSEAKNVPDNRM